MTDDTLGIWIDRLLSELGASPCPDETMNALTHATDAAARVVLADPAVEFGHKARVLAYGLFGHRGEIQPTKECFDDLVQLCRN